VCQAAGEQKINPPRQRSSSRIGEMTGDRDSKKECAMGDKGKKDKEKNRKRKLVKQEQTSKIAREKFAARFPLQKS
jgi:hypothetical protein